MESKESLAAGRMTPDLHIKGQFLGTELLVQNITCSRITGAGENCASVLISEAL